MSREDAEAVIAFIRTLPGVVHDVPRSQLNFPLNLLVRTMPSPAPPLSEKTPDPSDRLAYGRYLTTIAICVTCHTRMERGQPVLGMAFAGGLKFTNRSGHVQYSANITPDPNTGIGIWTEEMFLKTMRTGKHMGAGRPVLPPMPWQSIGTLSDEDLKAVFAYLRAVPAIKNHVPEPATPNHFAGE